MKIDPLSKEKYPNSFLNDIQDIQRNINDNEVEWAVLKGINSPAFSFYKKVGSLVIAPNTETQIPFVADDIFLDSANQVDLDNNQYVVPVTGWYQIGFNIEIAVPNQSTNVLWTVKLYYNDQVGDDTTWSFTLTNQRPELGIYPSFIVELIENRNLYFTIQHDDNQSVNLTGTQFSLNLFRIRI